MPKLAEIKNVTQNPNDKPRSVYVNPAQVISVEQIPNGTRILLNGEQTLHAALAFNEVVNAINQCMM